MCMSLIKTRIQKSIWGAIPIYETTKEFLEAIDRQLKPTNKHIDGFIMSELRAMKLTGTNGVLKHIMKIRDLFSQLKAFDMEPTEQFMLYLDENTLQMSGKDAPRAAHLA